MLNALVFSLLLLVPQQTPDPIKCVVVNLAPEPRLVCGQASKIRIEHPRQPDWPDKVEINDKEKFELVIPSTEWPPAWYPAHLTGIYNAEIREGQLYAVETKEPEGQSERIRARSLAELRRWRIQPTQRSGGSK